MNSIVGSLGNNYDFLKELSKTRTKYDLIDFSEKTTVIIDINKMGACIINLFQPYLKFLK